METKRVWQEAKTVAVGFDVCKERKKGPATDAPNFSAVTSMSSMFANATSANPDTSGCKFWGQSKVPE